MPIRSIPQTMSRTGARLRYGAWAVLFAAIGAAAFRPFDGEPHPLLAAFLEQFTIGCMDGGIVGAGIQLRLHDDVRFDDHRVFQVSHQPDVVLGGCHGRRSRAELEKKVDRIARIEQRVGVNAERPVVFMSLCLGDVEHVVEVSLADRTGLKYPMLIGRSFLEKGVLVNSADKFTIEPACDKK